MIAGAWEAAGKPAMPVDRDVATSATTPTVTQAD